MHIVLPGVGWGKTWLSFSSGSYPEGFEAQLESDATRMTHVCRSTVLLINIVGQCIKDHYHESLITVRFIMNNDKINKNLKQSTHNKPTAWGQGWGLGVTFVNGSLRKGAQVHGAHQLEPHPLPLRSSRLGMWCCGLGPGCSQQCYTSISYYQPRRKSKALTTQEYLVTDTHPSPSQTGLC